jgi:hypothetical protein
MQAPSYALCDGIGKYEKVDVEIPKLAIFDCFWHLGRQPSQRPKKWPFAPDLRRLMQFAMRRVILLPGGWL